MKIQTRQIRDNKRRDRDNKDTLAVGYQSQDKVQTEIPLEQQENLRNQILSEYKENSDVIPVGAQKNPPDMYHFWDKYPNRFGPNFGLHKEKKGGQGSVQDFSKWYNYFLDDNVGMMKPQEFIDEMWNNDYNRDKPVNDVLKDIQKSKKENMDKINKLLARKSFLQDAGNEYDIPDYLKNLVKPPLHDQKDVAKVPQELHGYLELPESENEESTESNKQDSSIEHKTGYREEMEYNDLKDEQEKHKKLKGKETRVWEKVTDEFVKTYPTFNFEPKYITLPSRSSSISTKQLEIKPNNPHPTVAQYYASPNLLYPMLIMSETTKSNKRIITKLRDNLIDRIETNSANLSKELIEDTETGIWNMKLALRNKSFHHSEHDKLSPSTEIIILKTETEVSTTKHDELEPTIMQYYQHQNFTAKIFSTTTKPALRTPTTQSYNNFHLGIFKSPVGAPTTHKADSHLSYESLNLSNEYNDLKHDPVRMLSFKTDAEQTTAHFRIWPIQFGVFKKDTEETTAHSKINPKYLGVFEVDTERKMAHSSIKPIHLGIYKTDTEETTAHSSIKPIHLGIFKKDTEETAAHHSIKVKDFKVDTEQKTAHTSTKPIHLGIFKADTEGTRAHSGIKTKHLKKIKTNTEGATAHSSIKVKNLVVLNADAKAATTHSNIEAKHLGIFKDRTKRITVHSSIEPIHLGVFKKHAKGTSGSSTVVDAIRLGLFKTHMERHNRCDDGTCPISSESATETTTTFFPLDTSTMPALFGETGPVQDITIKGKHNIVSAEKSRLTAGDLPPRPHESQLGKNIDL